MKNCFVSVKCFVVVALFASAASISAGSWSPLTEGTQNGLNGVVHTLAVNGDELYAGGNFTAPGSGTDTLRRIARWNGSAWSELYQGTGGSDVFAVAAGNGCIYVGGDFTSLNGVGGSVNRIARWDTAVDPANNGWSTLGNGIGDGVVYAIAVRGNRVY